jgi:hypothetical protein
VGNKKDLPIKQTGEEKALQYDISHFTVSAKGGD